MNRGIQGRLVRQTTAVEVFEAFIPHSLPPDPAVKVDLQLFEKASRAIGRLDALTVLLPNASLFLYFYVRKEAVLSSQIEGTQSSLSDLLLFEYDQCIGIPYVDVEEVSAYVAALNHGFVLMKQGLPISLRLIREIHGILLSKGRGSSQAPGEFRRSQNWIGGTRPADALFIPPPPNEVLNCMSDLEKFFHDESTGIPVLLKAALAHVQFETIHPFLDGNGRLGRLLITFLLCSEGALSHPLLYLSLYFKKHRQRYYELLGKVRFEGDWETWIDFFLRGVIETANQAISTAQQLLALLEQHRAAVTSMGQASGNVAKVYAYLMNKLVLEIPKASRDIGISQPTVMSAVNKLEESGILREITGRSRDRIYVYHRYIEILDEGIS